MRKTNQNRNESSFRSTRRGRHAAAAELRRAICEVIEPRIMLSATLGSHITASITPSSIPESLFLPASSTSDVYTSSTINQITSDSYRFSLNTTSAVTFNTGQVGSSGFASDVALGLYDSSGNLLQSQFTAGTGTSAVQTISATLSAGQVYELIAYIEKTSGTSLHTIALTANTGSQAIADTIAINPATNSGLLTASAAPDAFTSSTSVRYFPVNLLNADNDASVAISAAGPDTSVYAALYQQNIGGGSYVQLASGTGLPTLSLAPYEFQTVGSSATDYNYLLAVSPLNFSASAEAFKVTVSTDTPLLPATVSATPNSGSFTPVLSAPGTVSGTYNTGSTSTDSTVAVTAVVTGPMTVTASGVSVPVLGVYAPGGTSLLAVGTGAISASVTFNASAGQTYIMSTNPYNGAAVGNYTIQASQTNVPTTALSAGSTAATAYGVPVLPTTSGYQIFTVTPAAGADYLFLQAYPGQSNQTISITLAGANLPLETINSQGAGVATLATVNLDTNPGPVTVMVTDTSGTGGYTSLSYGTVAVPQQLNVGQLSTGVLSVVTGTLSYNYSSPAPNSLLGTQYQPLPQAVAGGSTTVSATVSAASTLATGAILLHYVQSGDTLNLTGSTAVAAGATGSLTLAALDTQLNAIAAIPFGTSRAGTVTLAVNGPTPTGVGLAMVPNVTPGQVTNGPYFSKFQVSNGTLQSTKPFDLWETQLPYNLSINGESTTLTFTPSEIGGPLNATISVLSSSAVLGTVTNAPGQAASLMISGLTPQEQLRIEVQPVAGSSLGTGSYGLYFQASTTDPRPYLITESTFYPYTSSQTAGNNYFPSGGIQSFAFGSDSFGDFTSSTPYSSNGTGSIQVFSVTVPAATPFQVYTEDFYGYSINTDIALYTQPVAGGPYQELIGSSLNQDYYPSSRASVDSKIVVNNYDLVKGLSTSAQTIYVVVMNEQGTQGSYEIAASAEPQSAVGPGSPTGTGDLLAVPYASSPYVTAPTVTISPNGSYQDVTVDLSSNPATTGNLTLHLSAGSSEQGTSVQVLQFDTRTVGNSYLNIADGTFNSSGNCTLTLGVDGAPSYLLEFSLTLVGYENFSFTASAVAPPLPSSGSVPPATTTNVPVDTSGAMFNSGFTRIEPAPDGTIDQPHTVYSGASGASGTYFDDLFTVETAGTVTLHANIPANGVAVGLYQVNVKSTGLFTTTPIGTLYDYTNTADSSGNYNLKDVLPVGTYILTASGPFPYVFGQPFAFNYSVTGSMPAFTAIPVAMNPSSDLVDEPAENIVDQAAGQLSYLDFQYQDSGTYFYEVTIPANADGAPLSVTVDDTDQTGDGNFAPGKSVGTISGTIWKVTGPVLNGTGAIGDTYTPEGVGYNMLTEKSNAINPQQGSVMELDNPVPGVQYLIGLDLNQFVNPAFLSVSVPPFTSSQPDLVVSPIKLSPDNGFTLVTLTVTNDSYGAAPSAPANFDFTNLNASTGATETPPLDEFGVYDVSYVWTPAAPSNRVTYIANSPQTITETNYNNNSATVVLSSVDAHFPTVTIALSDTAMSGESSGSASAGGGTWGRYISGVTGQTTNVVATGNDVDGDLYNVNLVPAGSPVGSSGINGSSGVTYAADFGKLSPTSASNLNLFNFSATDAYGLTTGTLSEKTDVVALPHYLTGGTVPMGFGGEAGSVTFSASTHQYALSFEYAVVNYNQSLSTLVGMSIPVIGDKTNEFLIAISGTGTTGLNPANNIPASLSGQIVLEVLSESIYNKTFSTYSPIKNLTFRAGMVLSGQTLEPTGDATVSAILSSTNLFNYETPLIPIFNYGIPGIASIEAGFKFGLNINLSAGAKIGLNLAGVPGATDFGIMSPTFIQPIITGNAQVSGQLTVLGFDAADVSGGITLTLTITLGLDNSNPGAVFSPGDALDDLSLNVGAKVGISLSASVLGFNVFSYNPTFNIGNIGDVQYGIFLTDPPSTAAGSFIPPTNGPGIDSGNISPDDTPPATTYGGTTAIGNYSIDPSPQLVIDPSSSNAISAQITNVGTANSPTGNLTVATRSGGIWSGSTILSDAGNVTSPQLALTHDSSGNTAAVLVYDVDNTTGSPVTQTRNTFLDSNDIRYRYYNGTTWSAEQSVTSDSLDDSEPSVAFNANGVGVMAYVHNTDSSPDDSSGAFDAASDDIRACIWNPTTHTWSSPLSITSNDGISDSTPSAFVDSSGNIYVVWVCGSGMGNELAYSMYSSTTGWSAAAVLPISGLPTGGQFNNVAVSASASGRVDVTFSYDVNNADTSVTSTLYDRPTTIGGFTAQATLVQIASGANYTGLRLTSAPSGSLVAYWGQSDGVVNQVFESTLASPTSAWTTPTQLTDDPNVAMEPTAAVDTNGTLQVLYDNVVPYGSTSAGNPTDPSVGAPMVSGVASSSVQDLPQLGFSSGLDFGYQTAAPTGASVTGQATVINRGLTSASVTISAYVGLPTGGTLVHTQTITLAAGASYTVSQAFTVAAGTQTYSLQLTTSGGQAFDTSEDLTTATLTGAGDLTALSLTPSDPNPVPGEAITLTGTIQNDGTTTMGPFSVALESGDPLSPQYPITTLATQNVTSLAGSATEPLNFNVTLPSGAGADVYTLVIDPSGALTEVTKANNDARYEVDFSADPAIVASSVVATLQNSSGVNNVQVTATVTNLGTANLSSFPVDLSDSFNGAAYAAAASPVTVPSLAAGASTTVTFIASGIAGNNEYEVYIDPSVTGLSNNVVSDDFATTDLIIQGLPTLVATISSLPGSALVGSALTLTANLSNIGIAEADNVQLSVVATLTVDGLAVLTTTIGSTTVSVAGALSSQNVSIPLTTSSLPAGAYTITLEVDPNLQILQGSRAGDTATATLNLTAPLVLNGSNLRIVNDPSYVDGSIIDVYSSGTLSSTVNLQFVSSITVTASSGSQALTVDYSNGDPMPAGGLTDTGPVGGGNTLTILPGSGYGYMQATVGASTIMIYDSQSETNQSISYSNLTGILFSSTGTAGVELTQAAQPSGGAGLYFNSTNINSTLDVQSGHFTFQASNTGSGINHIVLGNLNIGAGAVVSLSPPNGTSNRTLLVVGSLSLAGTNGAWSGKLDLSGNDLDIYQYYVYEPLSLIDNMISSGLANGTGGIVSTAAANNSAHLTTLAAILNQYSSGNPIYGYTNPFDGFDSSVNDILVKYTYYGDTNLDGKVDGTDYSRIDNGALNHLTGWFNGDFNYDGAINGSDYTLIDNAYNTQGASLEAELAAPAAVIGKSFSGSRGKPAFPPANLFQTSAQITIADSAESNIETLMLKKDVLDGLTDSFQL